jgi:hypothetical protein
MDRHLSVFLPYERPANHEDQLTRAAMIVVRAVPLARDALLARVGAPPLARLPEPEVDMQTRYVREPPAAENGSDVGVTELISVFLSPDEGLDLSPVEIEERADEQRLDGVLRFEDELVVVIESKIVGEAPSDQAKLLRLRGVEVEDSRVVALGWHELLEDWWSLLERGVLAPAERVLVEDLIAMAEEHFPHLLPFTTLRRAGEHELRMQRRLAALLRHATGIDEAKGESQPRVGAFAMLEGSQSTQRLSLQRLDDEFALCTWPAELKPQARAFYKSERSVRLLRLVQAGGVWQARPNVHLAYRGARPVDQRLYMDCRLELEEYVDRWRGQDFEQIRAWPHDRIREELWPWLRERGYASSDDDDRLGPFLERLGRRQAHLRPGVAVWHVWPWAAAIELDERGALVAEVEAAIRELLTVLEEPLPPALLSDA